MYNIVRQNGRPVHIVIKPDKDCVVNSGLGSVRGARMAELNYSKITSTQLQRLTDPMVWRYGQMQPTSWDDALSLVAEITAKVIKEQGEDGLFVSAFDHGGAGGGYENTWGTGKLYFGAMKIKNIRIHNRPAYNSEVHATRDMGVGELNNCYEDAELADTIVAVGTNALETQTNYFLNHWVPNLRGTSLAKKEAELPGEPHPPARIVIVDPRRTVTVNACEVEAGKDNVLHLAINSGTDLALFNAWLTYIAEQGWVDKDFLAASTTGFDEAVAANKTTLEQAAEITGLTVDQIRQAAHWIAEPKDGKRRRTMFSYEKGLIWGNDNYRTNGALVNVALATGNVGRPGGGCVRMGGHQEGYSRPSDAHVGRPAAYVDKLLIEGKGGVHHIWACDHYKTTLNAFEFKRVYKKRTDLVKDAMSTVPAGDRAAMVEAIMGAIRQGGLFAVDVDIVPSQIGEACHVWLPAATAGEMNLRALSMWSEGQVWCSPERHGAVSGVFKSQIDWLPLSEGGMRPTQGRTLAVMQVSGGSQSFNAVNGLRVLGRWMRMVTIPNQSSVPKAFEQFDEEGRMKPSPFYDRVVDVMEELMKFTLLLRGRTGYFLDRYSERREQPPDVRAAIAASLREARGD